MSLLAELTRQSRPIDAYTTVPPNGHILWESLLFSHCSSRAAWHDYQRMLASATTLAASDWAAYRDAIDKLYLYFRQHSIVANRATVTAPALAAESQAFERGQTHLCLYLRLDFDAGTRCAIEFAEGGELDLASGAMAVISGFRRHRLSGHACVLSFGADLPCHARIDALSTVALRRDSVLDAVVFCAATALPLFDPLPPPNLLSAKIEWLSSRARKHYRHQVCPVVRRFLVDAEDPATAAPEELARIRSYGDSAAEGESDALLHSVPVLSAEECRLLRASAADRMTSIVSDSVDDYPEYQVNFSLSELTELLGDETVNRLLRLPTHLGAPGDVPIDLLYGAIDCIVRIYSTETRPYIPFHADTCRYTANIALSNDADFQGGDLLAFADEHLQAIPRALGAAVVHSGHLVHGVTRIRGGERYSLILFFTARAQHAPAP